MGRAPGPSCEAGRADGLKRLESILAIKGKNLNKKPSRSIPGKPKRPRGALRPLADPRRDKRPPEQKKKAALFPARPLICLFMPGDLLAA
jgi:hypothetical protein